MITTVALNPSIDHTVEIESFSFGGLNRVLQSHSTAGGKGLNIALTASAMGVDAECIGLMYRDGSTPFERKFMLNSTAYNFVWCEGTVRTNIKVHDLSTGLFTEINEPGERISEEDIDKIKALVQLHAENSDYMVFAGSLPPGCPEDIYRTMIESVQDLDCRCVVDADGEALRQAIQAKPYMIKPNLYELEQLVGRELKEINEVRAVARQLIAGGIALVAVSLGEDGAIITNGDETWRAYGVNLNVKSTVGAGDAMTAGMVCGCMGEKNLETILRMGTACALARCATDDNKTIEKTVYKGYMDIPRIEKL